MQHSRKLGFKLDKKTAQKFRAFCDARGQNLSSVLRKLVLTELAEHSYLNEDEKRALGVK